MMPRILKPTRYKPCHHYDFRDGQTHVSSETRKLDQKLIESEPNGWFARYVERELAR